MSMFELPRLVRRRRDAFEWIMITIYCVLSAYLFASSSRPPIGIVLREVVSPFQLKARARNTASEQSTAAWRLSELESRSRRRLG